MRSEQLRDVIAPHLRSDIELDIRGISRSRMPSRSVLDWISRHDLVIMTKRVGYTQSQKTIEAIRETGVRVGIDHVDGKLDDLANLEAFDFHVIASMDGTKAFSVGHPNRPVFHIAHHADPRVPMAVSRDKTEAVYFGNPSHLYIPAGIEPRVTVLQAAHQRDAERSVGKLSAYNLHYAIRPDRETTHPGQFRPFTKGFNAAAGGANVIAQRGTADAVYYLGEDYPYLVNAANDAEVTTAFDHAAESYGSAEWRRGLETMRHVRNEVGPANIALQFSQMVNAALN